MADRQRGRVFQRHLPPESEDIGDIASQPHAPILFRPSHHTIANDFIHEEKDLSRSDASESGGKRKACPSEAASHRKKIKPVKRPDKKTKWPWSDDKVEELLKFVRDYKSKCEFNGVDFEADLQSLYTEVRRCMSIMYIRRSLERQVPLKLKRVLRTWTEKNMRVLNLEMMWKSRA